MTLSTPAEHAAGRRADAVRDDLGDVIAPEQTARERVESLAGTPETPVVVTSPEAHADEIAADVRRDTERKASAWGLGSAGDRVAEQLADHAGEVALGLLREHPGIEVSDE